MYIPFNGWCVKGMACTPIHTPGPTKARPHLALICLMTTPSVSGSNSDRSCLCHAKSPKDDAPLSTRCRVTSRLCTSMVMSATAVWRRRVMLM